MTETSEMRADGTVHLLVRHKRGERADPAADKGVIGLTFTSRDHLASFLRTFEPPEDDCYYDMRDFDLSGLDLTGAKMPHVHLAGADLTGTKLCNADIPYAWLRGAVMGDTDMTGANVHKARVDDQVFGAQVICASDTFNTAVNKPTKAEKKAHKRMQRSPQPTPKRGMRR